MMHSCGEVGGGVALFATGSPIRGDSNKSEML